MNLVLVFQWISIVLIWVAIVFNGWTTWRYRKLARQSNATAQAALDVLDQMEKSQDPGRSVHERLSWALEAGIVKTVGTSDPAGRRAAAMAVAAEMIDTIRRAKLELVAVDEEPPA